MKRLLFILLVLAFPSFAQTKITLDETVTYKSYASGANIERCNFYSQMFCRNLITINPGMQGMINKVIIPVSSATSTSLISSDVGDTLTSGQANGGTLWIGCVGNNGTPNGGDCTGSNLNVTRTITASAPATGGHGPTYSWASATPATISSHDTVYLIFTQPCTLSAWEAGCGWAPSGTVTVDTTSGDLPAPDPDGSQAKQVFEFTNTSSIGEFFDSGNQQYAFNGSFHATIRYRVKSGTPTGTFTILRSGGVNASPTTSLTADGAWHTATYTFSGTEGNTLTGNSVFFTFGISGTAVVDMVGATLTNDADTDPYWRNQTITDLTALNIGVFRMMHQGKFQGETLDNWIAPPTLKQMTNTNRNGYLESPETDMPPQSALNLAESLGAPQAQLPVPMIWTSTDYVNFVEWLNGPSGTTYGDKRIAEGHTAAYKNSFDTMYFSIGNEVWNVGSFSTSIPFDGSYWNYVAIARYACQAMKSSPYWDSTKMKCVATVQTGIPFWTQQLVAQNATGNYIDVVDANAYQQYNIGVNGSGTNTPSTCVQSALFQSPSDEAWANVFDTGSDMYNTVAAGLPVEVYEWANGTTGLYCNSSDVNPWPTTQGYVTAMINVPLLQNRVQGVKSSAFWQLSQDPSGITLSGNSVSIQQYSLKTGMGASLNAQTPGFQGLALYNACARLGTGYTNISQSGSPTHNSVARNSVHALTNVQEINMAEFGNGTSRCLVITNTNLTTANTVTIAGTNVPTGTVTTTTNSSGSLTANNDGQNITPTNFNAVTTGAASSTVSVPAHGAVSITWTTGAPPPPTYHGQIFGQGKILGAGKAF